ncbi:hypothetical protein GO988_07160 [Hymenobacter sp. HMF4947]|uniref:Uncharacterized protein n=1 Tax=Hymenobacter ginkgonis TaxID=2682976 RepID=A0A7K1TCG4_9BACT|nr:hypothetical protein [Hymenobacter ginkgonis]MVN76099.1 hypothetical protein [Hymenobacter ginkgonis]
MLIVKHFLPFRQVKVVLKPSGQFGGQTNPFLMDNARIIIGVMLATVALYAAPNHAKSGLKTHRLATFFSVEGTKHHQRRTRQYRHVTRVAHTPIYTVTATAYQAVVAQTDDEPFVTADNSRIQRRYSSKTRWMALSQDLLARWGGKFQYGDKVRVRGLSPQLDGVYTVHDTMHKRHRHCIDILTHPTEKFDIFTPDVKIQLAVANPNVAYSPALDQRRKKLAGPRLTRSARPARKQPQRDWFANEPSTSYLASAIL